MTVDADLAAGPDPALGSQERPLPPAQPATTAWHVAANGARLQLWPQRAAFDPEQRLLLVADAHLGKAVAFRRLGVPVPEATTAEALDRLDALLAATGARELVFLGDLLHSARVQGSTALDTVADWRRRHSALALTLVRGNHDRQAGDPPRALGIAVCEGPLRRGPWALAHAPGEAQAPAGGLALCGHVHPGLRLHGRGGDRLRLPCYHFSPSEGVLPAFGPFTGLHLLPRGPHDRVYAVTETQVLPVAAAAAAAPRYSGRNRG